MMTLALLAVVLVAGAFAVQVLRSVDLPKYRGLIVKVLLGTAAASAGGLAWGATGIGTGRPFAMAHAVVGVAGLGLSAWRAWHYHALRREIDLPTNLSRGPDPHLEGPAAQSAKRRAARTAKGDGT